MATLHAADEHITSRVDAPSRLHTALAQKVPKRQAWAGVEQGKMLEILLTKERKKKKKKKLQKTDSHSFQSALQVKCFWAASLLSSPFYFASTTPSPFLAFLLSLNLILHFLLLAAWRQWQWCHHKGWMGAVQWEKSRGCNHSLGASHPDGVAKKVCVSLKSRDWHNCSDHPSEALCHCWWIDQLSD